MIMRPTKGGSLRLRRDKSSSAGAVSSKKAPGPTGPLGFGAGRGGLGRGGSMMIGGRGL